MNRIVRLTFTLWLLLALAACAPALTPAAVPTVAARPTALPQPTPVPPTPVSAAQPGGVFFARPQGEAGPLIAYDMATGAIRFSLPAGMLSADSQHFLAAKTGAGTQLLGYDLTTGAERPIGQLTGQWELSSVSATGRWAALMRIPAESEKQAWSTANVWKTGVQVVDTHTGKIAHQLELDGNFVVDTLSAQGDSLFVIQYLPAVKPDHYQVRLFDLTTGTLQDGALVDKRDSAEVMAGQRWQAVATSDGSWLYTLYLRTSKNTAFIHALNTVNKFAMCFDLPAVNGSTLDQLKAYTIALDSNGQTVYAANPALGVIARVDVNSFDVSSVASFAPDQGALSASAPGNYSVADERGLYFTGGKQIWAFDATTRQVKSLSKLDNFISGLALGRDGRQLFVARVDQPPVMLDTTSGAAFSSQ
jgi:hypothetical protein